MESTGTPNQAMPQTGESNPKDPKQPVAPTPNGAGAQGTSIKDAAQEAKRRLKIDDQEVDEDEVVKIYKERKGHQRAANKELQEGRSAKKQAEEFISMMKDKQKLFDVIKRFGHDPRQLSEEYLATVLEDEMLDPREKKLRETEAQLRKYQQLEKAQKEEVAKRRDEELKSKYAKDYNDQFVEALKTTNLPPTKAMIAEMAKYVHRSAKIGFEMTAEEAAKLVREDIEASHSRLYGETDAETLVRLLGETGLQKIRQYETSRIKDPNANLKTPTEQGEPNTKRRESSRRMSIEEWRTFNRK